jgi:hypothetical protein
MRLHFAKADLLLHKNLEGEFILELSGKELGKFKQEKKALAAYNKIRTELEKELPPTQTSDAERRELLQKYLADNLVGHNSWLEPKKSIPKSRIHHS